MKHPKVMEMALAGATMGQALKYTGTPRWLLRLLFGENILWNIDVANELISDNEYAIQISDMINGEK
jgi:hypothetical protein